MIRHETVGHGTRLMSRVTRLEVTRLLCKLILLIYLKIYHFTTSQCPLLAEPIRLSMPMDFNLFT